jgi:hypothetical protein
MVCEVISKENIVICCYATVKKTATCARVMNVILILVSRHVINLQCHDTNNIWNKVVIIALLDMCTNEVLPHAVSWIP